MRRVSALAVTVWLAACATPSAEVVPAAVMKEALPVTLELLSAGQSGAAAPLRYVFAEGALQQLEISSEVNLTIEASGQPAVRSQVQRIVLRATAEVTQVEPNGNAHLRVKVTHAELQQRSPLASGEALKKQVSGLENQTAELIVDAQGRALQTSDRFERIPGALLDLVVFPDEAVSEGARWRTRGQRRAQGVLTDRKVEYELVSRRGSLAMLRGTVTSTAGKQMVTQRGQSQEVLGLNAQGRFESTVESSHLFATRQSSGTVALDLNIDGNRVTISTAVQDEISPPSQ